MKIKKHIIMNNLSKIKTNEQNIIIFQNKSILSKSQEAQLFIEIDHKDTDPLLGVVLRKDIKWHFFMHCRVRKITLSTKDAILSG